MAFRPRKRFGQNFLHDPGIARKMIDAARLEAGQAVVELGAGRGFLTRPLAELGTRLIAFELDRDLHAELSARLEGTAGVELINADFTHVSLTSLLAERGLDACTLIGNIPYHLTREVLFSFLVDESEMIEKAYLMVQREVGDRIAAAPGSRTYGIPSVVLQSLYTVRSLFRVVAGSFTPRPKVDSVVIGFEALESPRIRRDELRHFVGLVKNLFQQRRKTIHNTLRGAYSLSATELRQLGKSTGIDPEKRPEMLSPQDFLAVSRAIAGMTPGAHGDGTMMQGRRW
ncbi:MAG: 16S rRNA (adenine(1518)-N(6)/adenine(1519)-N(6))-dimethyltransferase RsmA [Candidatus Krumholzibacteriia bacterium]